MEYFKLHKLRQKEAQLPTRSVGHGCTRIHCVRRQRQSIGQGLQASMANRPRRGQLACWAWALSASPRVAWPRPARLAAWGTGACAACLPRACQAWAAGRVHSDWAEGCTHGKNEVILAKKNFGPVSCDTRWAS